MKRSTWKNSLIAAGLVLAAGFGGSAAAPARAAAAPGLPVQAMAGLAAAAIGGGLCPPEEAVGQGEQDPLKVQLPQDDPFYRPPAGYASCANGYVLRSRKIAAEYLLPILSTYTTTILGQIIKTLDVFKVLGNLSGNLIINAYQVLYKSADSHGEPTTGVVTILVPQAGVLAGGRPWNAPTPDRPVVAYQLAIDSVSSKCSPSYTLQTGLLGTLKDAVGGQGLKLPASLFEMSLSLPALLHGYAVAYADHGGPDAEWIAGRQSGQSVLDGVRATLNYRHYRPGDSITSQSKVALSGYSGGGGATDWAVELADSYAPDLRGNLVGAAIGASSNADIEAMYNKHNGKLTVGLLVLAITGLNRAYPESGIYDYLNAAGKSMIDGAGDQCTIDGAIQYGLQKLVRGLKLENYTQRPDVPVPDSEPGRKIFEWNSIVNQAKHELPRIPVLNYHDQWDGLVPVNASNDTARKLCREGSPVEVVRIATPLPNGLLPLPPFFQDLDSAIGITTHVTGETFGALPALQYLVNRFHGLAPRNDCPKIPSGDRGWQTRGWPIPVPVWVSSPWEQQDPAGLVRPVYPAFGELIQ